MIIEDDANKLTRIFEFVQLEHPHWDVTIAKSYQSGLKRALDEGPEILLLDMSLPTYEVTSLEKGGRPRPFAGREIMHQLSRRGSQTRVIIVTQFDSFGEGKQKKTIDQMRAEVSSKYHDNYIGMVYYNPSSAGWRDSLRKVLSKAINRNVKTSNQ